MNFIAWIVSLFKYNPKPLPKEEATVVEPPKKEAPVEVKPAVKASKTGWDDYWTEHLKKMIYNNLSAFDSASDILSIRPDWFRLSETQRTEVMAEFFKRLAYFESSFNPKSESIDVGTKFDKQTWSVGLLQLSGVDKSNLGLSVGFDYEGLLDPIKNLTQGVAIMVNQIHKRGKILISKGEKGNPSAYWAPLILGGKYDKTAHIILAVQALKFEVAADVDPIPWMKIAYAEVGVSEQTNPARILEYHQATSYRASDVKTAWCSSFACWVLKKAGKKTTYSAWARDWLDYGVKCEPKKGCVMIFERNGIGGDSHVGFYTGHKTETGYILLSGNTGDAVVIKEFPKERLLGCRFPE